MSEDLTDSPDVLVIGGGPAGSTIATLLARSGRSVVLLEKDCHPRFHIGESLLPMNLPILERLGVLDQVSDIGVPKLGADFTCPPPEDETDSADDGVDEHQTYLFSRALGNSADHAFEVKRAEFDEILFRNAGDAGAILCEGTRVTKVTLDPRGKHVVHTRTEQGNAVYRPRYVVDASGRDALLASGNGWKKPSSVHASAAVFGHFRGVPRRAGANAGNISVYWSPVGWIWMIPLRDDVMSVGAVCWPEHFKSRNVPMHEFLVETLKLCPAAWRRVSSASLLGQARGAGNYSYRSETVTGPGFLLAGDAFAFLDPVFSSGVYLAMSSAERAVAPINAWLDNCGYRAACRRYERTSARGLKAFSWFIYRFTSPAMRQLFRDPRNVFRVEDAVVSMLAGDVFQRGPVQRRLAVFRAIYRISWLISWKDSWVARKARLRNARQAALERS